VFKRNKKYLVYLLVLILPALFLLSQQTAFSSFKLGIVQSNSLPVRIILLPLLELKKIVFYHATYNEYTRLKNQVDALKSKLSRQEEIFRENARLKELLDFKKNTTINLIAADVIARDPSGWTSAVIVDKGSREGVRQGMAVVGASGIIGRIVEVGKKASKVMLLNDPGFSVAAVIERSREAGLITGTLQGVCRMRYLSPQADIKVGDRVITSKLSSIFPEGLPIGEVISVQESQSSPTLECFVKPIASPSQIEEVLIKK